jgi:hemoglobin
LSDLYEKLGGVYTINDSVEILYEKLLKDPRINFFFKDIGIDQQIHKQKAFMTMALGGPTPYSGKSLRVAHRPLLAKGLSDKHFDIFIEHFSATLREMGLAEDLIAEAVTISNGYRNDVLNR